jgi:MFS family permease
VSHERHEIEDNAKLERGLYYGWVMLPLAALLQIASSPGQTFGVSVFNTPIRESLHLGHSQITGSYLLASLLAAAPMPLVGWAMDRFGLRRTALFVVVLLGAACMVISRATGLVTLTLGFLLLRTFGQGSLSLLANNTLAMWFSRRLGLVSGLMGIGISAAVAVVPTVYLALIDQLGWRNAYAVLGLVTCVVLVPLLVFVFRNGPEEIGQTLDGAAERGGDDSASVSGHGVRSRSLGESLTLRAAWRSRAYWIGLVIGAMWGMIATAVFFNIVPVFEWQGLTPAHAAATFTTFAVSMALLQLIGGALADRLPMNLLLAASVFGLLAGVVVLWNVDSTWLSHVYAVLFGAAQGLMIAVNNTFWPRYFGRAHLGQIRSSVWTATVAGCSLGPFAMGLSIDYLGGYGPSLALFSVLLACGTVAALFATPPSASFTEDT